MNRLGIDFGTSFSTMCFFNEKTNAPETIRDENGLDKIPSIVYWGADGIKVGQAALDIFYDSCELGDDAERIEVQSRIFKSVKQDFFPDRNFALSDGSVVEAVDVAAEILKYLKEQAERRAFQGESLTDVCITHPVSFIVAQKKLLELAAKKAGFSSVELLPEPVAAALGYAASAVGTVGENILVYDLGGGTLDIALVHRNGECDYNIPLEPLGDAYCGGDDFDKLLYDYFEKQLAQGQHFNSIPDTWDLKTLFECCKFKEALSRRENATFRAYNDQLHFSCSMTRREFNELIAEKIRNSLHLLNRMLDAAKAAGYRIDTVILIGGSSRIPLVKELLREKLPIKPLETMRDDVAVAMGASIDLAGIRRCIEEEKRRREEEERKKKLDREKQRKREMADLEEKKRILEREKQELAEKQKKFTENLTITIANRKSEQENAEEIFLKAHQYETASGANANLAEALILYRKAAEANHAMAQNNLGEMYYHGKGVAINYPEALRWYKKAAEQGIPAAMMMVAGMYRNANGCEQSWTEVAKWYEKAAETGDLEGQFETGYGYLAGRGVSRNLSHAIQWLTKAAIRGHANAQYYLGLCFEQGRGVHKSESEAMKWFKAAMNNGHARAGGKVAGDKLRKWWSGFGL